MPTDGQAPSVPGYTVEGPLGSGAHGRLFAAIDQNTGAPVAIKLLHLEGAQVRARFYDEARLLSRIRDPHVVSVYGFGELDDGRPYIVLERFGDADLSRCSPTGVPAPLEFAVHMMTQLLSGLAAAHELGIVHRDVKESNLLVDRDSMVAKLCDFGIARSQVPLPEQADPTSTEVVVGTPHYIAPERFRGVRRDPRSDLYSAGVVFHRLLTGRLPFDAPGLDGVAIARRALTEEVPFIEGIPEALVRVCLRLLERDVEARFQTARAAMEALHYARHYGADAGETLDLPPDDSSDDPPSTGFPWATVLGIGLFLAAALTWTFWP